MTLEKRIWNLGNLTILLLMLASLRIVYWQLVRGDELQPVALNPVAALADYAKRAGGEVSGREEARTFLQAGIEGGSLKNLPQPVVQRTMDLLETITRGNIYDRNGRLLATDRVSEDGEKFRFYSEPSLAHAIGYVSGLRTGIAGLERSYNETLLGLNLLESQVKQVFRQPIQGSDLILTIDSQVQRAVERSLQGKAGAILVLDASSGAILAMASAPRFDPNRILEEGYVAGWLASCDGQPECEAPFLNRATQALYPPGSTWKTVTLIAALDSGQVTPETVFDFGQPRSGPNGPYFIYEVDGGVIPDPNHQEARLDLEMSYAKSANAAFARMGDEMPPDVLIEYAGRLGFGEPGSRALPMEIEFSQAQLTSANESLYDNNLLRAVTAIGQGELLTSPMTMALGALAVLNEGDLPIPYLVESVRAPDGTLVNDLPNRRLVRDIMRPETARLVRKMMVSVVERGSGGRAKVPGLTVGGKTGTAQIGGGRLPHAWFLGFAEGADRAVVIVVLIENGGEGSQAAAPVFAELAQVALGQLGQPVEEVVPTPLPPEVEPEEPSATTTAPVGEPTLEAGTTQAPEPTLEPEATATPAASGVPPPDIWRDPTKADITAGSTCPITREASQGTGIFIWPSQYQALSGTDFEEGHPGIDLSAPSGTPVFAADSGLVIFAGWAGAGYGNTVLIDHGNGYKTLYAHLSQVSTVCSARVEKGKIIGLSGNTGNSSGPHLHFEVRVPGGYLNPLKVLPLP